MRTATSGRETKLHVVTWRLVAPLLATLAIVASGCGESSDPVSAGELEAVVVLARDRVDFALAEVTRAQSKDEFLERMDKAADTIADAAGDVDEPEAPQRYRSDVDVLATSLEQLAFDVQATADQVRQPDFGGLLEGVRGLSFESWNSVNRALVRLARKGIDVAPLERH
ncbi:MAG: hypothetical protein ACRDQT_09100 [Gaiellaceae bacterium]